MNGPDDPQPEASHEPASDEQADHEPIVDWSRTARRVAVSLSLIATAVVVAWLALGATGGQFRGRLLGELLGFGVLAAFAAEFVIVGGAAVRGMLRAGARGDRLAGGDVSLLPPQARRRRRR